MTTTTGPTRRLERVEKEITKLVAEYAVKNLSGKFSGLLSVMSTNVSQDLKHATVMVSALNVSRDEDDTSVAAAAKSDDVIEVFEEARIDIQHFLGKNLNTKFSPKLKFELDTGTEKTLKVQKLIEDLTKKS